MTGARAISLAVAALAIGACGGVTPIRTAFNRGVYQSSQANPDGAVREYRLAVEEDPSDVRARFNLACALEDVAALRNSEASKSKDASSAAALTTAGALARSSARAEYVLLLTANPSDLRAAVNLAAMDFEDADRSGDAALEAAGLERLAAAAAGGHVLPARSLAARHLLKDRRAEAAVWIGKALAADGSDVEALFLKGRLAAIEGRFDDALQSFDEVLTNAPDDVAALLASGESERLRAAAARSAGDIAAAERSSTEAIVRYRRAAMVRRDVYAAHFALAELEAEAGDDETAVAHLLAAKRLDDLRRGGPRPDYEGRLAALYERLAAKHGGRSPK